MFSLDITGQNYRALFVSDSLDLRARMVTSEMGLPQVLVELVESWSMGGPGFSLSPLSPGGFKAADKLPTAAAANDTLAREEE